ncbi:LA_2272 family surface repeat-containing protein [Bacteroides sp.]|uniref:LA_2272 family surface repeat-containing protein n=1 Tax=Bacteroides sp. TaxID=29523 RepID=UPI002FC71818
MKKLWITAALIVAAVGLSAQNKSAGINLSLWKKIATQPIDSLQTTYFNIGFQSTMNRLNGVSINLLPGVVHQDMNGVQLSAISNLVGRSMRGVQVSGISNINGNNMAGLSATGLVNIAGHQAQGVLVSGLTNIAGDHLCGVMASGLVNISGNQGTGVQIAGLANIAGSSFTGVTTSGLLNVVGGSMKGLQLSGLGNITADRLTGAQVGLLNYTTSAKGLQIGLVNYYKDDMKGLQLGLVNANPDTKVQMMLFGGNATKLNVAARFKNKLFYTLVGGGTHYLDFNDKFSAAVFYRGGLWLPLYKTLSISGDLGYQHMETFGNKHNGIPARLYALQGRINLEMQLTQKLGIFATGGYGIDKQYGKSRTYDKGLIVEAGIILF